MRITVDTEKYTSEEIKGSIRALANLLPYEERTRIIRFLSENLKEDKKGELKQSRAKGGGSFMGEPLGI